MVVIEGDETFEIYHCDVVQHPGFKEFHKRLQTFIMFFIDGASYIDDDDDKWQYFVM
jgi:histone acetyltransferase 1